MLSRGYLPSIGVSLPAEKSGDMPMCARPWVMGP